jgi:hypothetical protein
MQFLPLFCHLFRLGSKYFPQHRFFKTPSNYCLGVMRDPRRVGKLKDFSIARQICYTYCVPVYRKIRTDLIGFYSGVANVVIPLISERKEWEFPH